MELQAVGSSLEEAEETVLGLELSLGSGNSQAVLHSSLFNVLGGIHSSVGDNTAFSDGSGGLSD